MEEGEHTMDFCHMLMYIFGRLFEGLARYIQETTDPRFHSVCSLVS